LQWFCYIPGPKNYLEALKHSNSICRRFAEKHELKQLKRLIRDVLPTPDELREMLSPLVESDRSVESVYQEYECWCTHLQACEAYKEWTEKTGKPGHHDAAREAAKEAIEIVLKYPGGWLKPR
jgi:hypothetical protein